MPRRHAAPIVLAVVAAATWAGARDARAGDDCLAAPNAGAPPGNHWYYRLDRASHRKCWYLGAEGATVRRAARATPAAAAPAAAPPLPAETAAAASPQPAPAAAAPDTAFASRWPVAADSAVAAAAAPRPHERIAARPVPTSAERAQAHAATPPAAAAHERTALPATLAGVAILLATVGTILVRAGRRAAATRSPDARAARHSRRPRMPAEASTDIAGATFEPAIDPLPPEPIDAAPDVEQSLRQLLQAWERLAA
ncbi:MAG TPA: hypothetical protein VEK73_03230 [Xanthobacteraceae bacterium]|nr:hypothetical protein [Xanthobacteraceae bacterium]